MDATTYADLRKHNPYRDKIGRFATKNGHAGGTYTQEEQIAALTDWSDGGYGEIRRAQTGAIDDAERRAQAEAIEEYIEQQPPYTGDLYRGIATDEPVHFRVGQTISMNGLSSWTKSEEIADEFTQFDTYAYCFVTQGLTRAADVSKHMMNPGEQEVLVSAKTKFRIKSTEFDPDLNQTIVVVEEERS